MTDPRPTRRVARTPQASTTAAGASVVFLGALGVLGWQMAHGNDPALGAQAGAAAPVAAVARAPREVLERRVVRRVVVTRVVTDPEEPGEAPGVPAPAAVATPVVRTSAPVVVQTAAPAPAPVPSPPVQTRTS